jgi:AraC-like DNA-binding protein
MGSGIAQHHKQSLMNVTSGELQRPLVLAAAAHGVSERIAAAGVDPCDVFAAAGLEAQELQDPTRRISLSQYCQVFEIAAHKTMHSSFGLEFGSAFHPQHLGMLGYLAISAPTLGMALRKFSDYLPAHQQATHLAVRTLTDGRAMIEYAILDGSIRARQQDAELSIAMLLNVFRHCLGSSWLPMGLHFMHARPPGRTRHEELLGARPLFAQTSNRIIFRQAELDCEMPRRDHDLLCLLESQLGKQLADTRACSDIVERVRHEMGLALEAGGCDVGVISKRCGISPWTLKRRLKQRGLTFQDLLTATRIDLARRQLSRGEPVTNVAADLGYSQVSAFSRAFRQWTGVSPREYLRRRG